MIPWFRFSRAPWGTVYLMQSRNQPRLFKVGYTKRKTKDRRAELNPVARDDMKIVATIQTPWATKCEALLLRRLRRNPFRKRDRRGTEWFHLGKKEDIAAIVKKLKRASVHIEISARIKFSWPTNSRRKLFEANKVSRKNQTNTTETVADSADMWAMWNGFEDAHELKEWGKDVEQRRLDDQDCFAGK